MVVVTELLPQLCIDLYSSSITYPWFLYIQCCLCIENRGADESSSHARLAERWGKYRALKDRTAPPCFCVTIHSKGNCHKDPSPSSRCVRTDTQSVRIISRNMQTHQRVAQYKEDMHLQHCERQRHWGEKLLSVSVPTLVHCPHHER